ncbi:DNRLRE domain-containing protein [candidate division WOR-3 bacterium]|nr:DNRLRE domain-containing protein [candidate division WOR-3 bacterium]
MRKNTLLLLIFISIASFAQQLFTFQQGMDGYDGCRDAHIFINKPSWNTGGEDMFEATGNGTEADAKHALIRFDVSSLSPETVIDSAWVYLRFKQRRTTQGDTKELGVYRLNIPWGEGVGNDFGPNGNDGRRAEMGECNWEYAFYDTVLWTTSGCNGVPGDREGTPESIKSFTTGTPIDTWHSWTLTNMCQHWITYPDSNFGFALREPVVSSATGILDFASSEYIIPEFRPILYVRLYPEPKTYTDTITETHTYNSIIVVAKYDGDTDSDGHASLSHKLNTESIWQPDTTMKKEPFEYKCTIGNLSPGSVYDIRVTYFDPDGVVGKNQKYITDITLPNIKMITDSITADVLASNMIKVNAYYEGDGNQNGSAILEHKQSIDTSWINDGNMQRENSSFQRTIFGLTPDTDYDARVTYQDPDSVEGENPQILYNIHTLSGSENVTLNSWDSTHFNITMGEYTIEYNKATTNGYILIYRTSKSENALATKIVNGSQFNIMNPEYVDSISATETEEEILITIKSVRDWADFTSEFRVYKQSYGLINWKTNVSTKQDKVITDNPRDIWFYNRTTGSLTEATINKYAKQLIFASGICYLYEDATWSSVFYFEDFSSLNNYFMLKSPWAPDRVVDASTESIGYMRPISPSTTIPQGISFDIVDTYIYLISGIPETEVDKAERFTYSLSEIYNHIYKPDTVYTDWQEVVSYELLDLLESKCWVTIDDVNFLRAYVDIPRYTSAELIAQLDVLVAIKKYEQQFGDVTDIDSILEINIPYFYNDEHQTIVNNYPNAGISQGDSWYTMELHIGLAKLAKMGSSTANSLLFSSIQTVIDFAQNVNYEFPVFFSYETNDRISGSEPDVAGGYAYLMLECYDITGEGVYLSEAMASIEHIKGKGFGLSYELQMTAACATSCARLYEITGDIEYLRMSYMPLANIMRCCWLWECDYGYASDYLTFFGMSPMQEAGVITMKEQYETWGYLREYQNIAKELIPDYFSVLIDGFIDYTPSVMRYSLPPFLPNSAVWTETCLYGSVNDTSMYIPFEDLRQGWDKSGYIGQEIYGAGGPITIAALLSGIDEQDNGNYRTGCLLLRTYPNPFVKSIAIDYLLTGRESALTTLKVYNILGQYIRTLIKEKQKAGRYTVRWDGKDNTGRQLSNGIYFLLLERGESKDTKKILRIR